MTATAHATTDGTAAASRRLSSVASGAVELIWPLYLTLVLTLGGWVAVPTVVLGWKPITIISGSMAPTVQPGHVVVVEPYRGQELRAGAVVTYRDAMQDRLVTHRIAGVDRDGTFTTKGDANAVDDPVPLTADRIVGVARLVVPAAGLPTLWAHQGRTDLVAVVAVLTVLTAAAAASAASTGARTVRQRLALRRAAPRRSRLQDVGLATGVIAVVAVLGAAAVSRAAFVAARGNDSNSFQAATVAPPTGLTATPGCGLLGLVAGPLVDLGWAASDGATGYEVLRATAADPDPVVIGTTTTTAFRDRSVSHSTTYHYRVRAITGTWTSAGSATASATTASLCVL